MCYLHIKYPCIYINYWLQKLKVAHPEATQPVVQKKKYVAFISCYLIYFQQQICVIFFSAAVAKLLYTYVSHPVVIFRCYPQYNFILIPANT